MDFHTAGAMSALGHKRTFPEVCVMSALCHVWTYMDPARLQQADWIGCNSHNC
jgi:hypothetical protein